MICEVRPKNRQRRTAVSFHEGSPSASQWEIVTFFGDVQPNATVAVQYVLENRRVVQVDVDAGNGFMCTLFHGDWLVRDNEGNVTKMSTEDFNEKYEVA